MKTILLFSVVVLLMVFTSCKKDRFPVEPTAPQTMEELTVPSSFDWKTTKEVNLNSTDKWHCRSCKQPACCLSKSFSQSGNCLYHETDCSCLRKKLKVEIFRTGSKS